MVRHTNGQRRTAAWVEEQRRRGRINVARIAEALNVSPPAVHAWLRGDAVPDAVYRSALRELTGIPESEWITADEQARTRAAVHGARKLAEQIRRAG